MKKIILIFISLFISNVIISQTLKRTIGIYSTELNEKEINGKSRQTKVTINTNTNQLTIEDNLAAIRTDDLNSDSLNGNATPIKLKFDANMQKSLNSIFKDNINSNLIRIEGTLTINGISKEATAFWVPMRFSAASNDVFIDFILKFLCEDYNLSDAKFQFSKLVEFDIEDGFVNKIE